MTRAPVSLELSTRNVAEVEPSRDKEARNISEFGDWRTMKAGGEVLSTSPAGAGHNLSLVAAIALSRNCEACTV